MSVKRRALKVRTGLSELELTFFQGYLLSGYYAYGEQPDDSVAEQLWKQHKGKLLEYWSQHPIKYEAYDNEWLSLPHFEPGGPCTRPWGFWEFEGFKKRSTESDFAALLRHHLLDETDYAFFHNVFQGRADQIKFLQNNGLNTRRGVERWILRYIQSTEKGKACEAKTLKLLLKTGFLKSEPTFENWQEVIPK